MTGRGAELYPTEKAWTDIVFAVLDGAHSVSWVGDPGTLLIRQTSLVMLLRPQDSAWRVYFAPASPYWKITLHADDL